eukprot:7709557-Ditylum_brightwellii.AAC.1
MWKNDSVAWLGSCTTPQGLKLFDNFKEILTDSAEEKWDTLTSRINQAAQDVPHFDQAIKVLQWRGEGHDV